MPKKIKKDFDKEKMYSKIMPSVAILPVQEENGSDPAANEPPPSAGTPQLLLRNFIEDIVLDKLVRTISMLRACECERCKKDVMARALNELPTAYTVIEAPELEANVKQLRANYEVKVSSALIKAVQEVKQNPNH